MIRPFTVVTMLLAAASGLYLYQSKHRVQMLDRDIAHTWKSVDEAHARTGLLRAEWALLNEPDRLGELADRHLAVKPLAPGQFISMTELERRLPPPGSAVPHDAAPLEPQELPPAGPASASGPADHPTDPARAPAPAPVAAGSIAKPTATAANNKPPGSTLSRPVTRTASISPPRVGSTAPTSLSPASTAGTGAPPTGDAAAARTSVASVTPTVITARTDAATRVSRVTSTTSEAAITVPVVATSLGGAHPALAAPVPYTPPGGAPR